MTGLLTKHWQLLLAVLLGLAVGGLLLIRPQLTALAETRTAAEHWQAKLHDSRSAKAAIPAQRDALSQLRERINDYRVQIPAQADVTDMLANITRTATDSGVRIQQITPSADRPDDGNDRQKVRLLAHGRWQESMNFLHRLMTSPAAITIEEFAIYPRDANPSPFEVVVEMTLIGHAAPYADIPSHERRESALPGARSLHTSSLPAALKNNPFAHDGTAFAPSVHRLPFSYAGRIQKGRTTWALLMDENGVIHRQRIGAEFDEGWRLINLDESAVFLKDPQGQIHPIPLRNSRQPREQ